MNATKPPGFDDLLQAQARIAPHVHNTPVMTSAYLDALSGAQLFFKCENLQKVGAFKARGACNAVFGLDEETAARGVATHSSGNHAAALSYAAQRRGIEATVVIPTTAPAAKKAAVAGYGGRIIECEPTLQSRESTLARVVAESGADLVHPYNDARVIAGQATCALELLEQADGLDALVAPIGGGGLISGTCLALAGRNPDVRVVAAEPANADDAYRSVEAGRLIRIDTPQTVADGLRSGLGDLTWAIVRNHVDAILRVDETEILDAMYLIWQRMKLIVEPSSSVALAAILKHREQFAGRRVGVILTGGNVDLKHCPGCRG